MADVGRPKVDARQLRVWSRLALSGASAAVCAQDTVDWERRPVLKHTIGGGTSCTGSALGKLRFDLLVVFSRPEVRRLLQSALNAAASRAESS